MHTPYKVEVFSRDFTFHGFSPIPEPELEYDYLSLGKSSITVQDLRAEKGDFAIITDGYGAEIYSGIVDDIIREKKKVQITIKPLISIFDCDAKFDRTTSAHIEQFLAGIVQDNFISSGDVLQDVTGMAVRTTSDTLGALNLKDDIHNIYDIMSSALTGYGIVVNMSLRPQQKEIICTIGKEMATATIEADLPCIIDKSITIGDSYGKINKITIYNKADAAQFATYYLHPDGSISNSDADRITPVFFSAAFVETSADEFSGKAYAQAYNTLAAQKYDNLIEITCADNCRLIPSDMRIGTTATIYSGGNAYSSILTGLSRRRGLRTLVFGFVRADLTKIISIERRKTT